MHRESAGGTQVRAHERSVVIVCTLVLAPKIPKTLRASAHDRRLLYVFVHDASKLTCESGEDAIEKERGDQKGVFVEHVKNHDGNPLVVIASVHCTRQKPGKWVHGKGIKRRRQDQEGGVKG